MGFLVLLMSWGMLSLLTGGFSTSDDDPADTPAATPTDTGSLLDDTNNDDGPSGYGGSISLSMVTDTYLDDSLSTEIHGLAGNDILQGNAGDDTLFGDRGYDRLEGGSGDDRLYGGQDDDGLFGQAGNDRLFGSDGYDILVGGDGDDLLNGGNENDIMVGGTGQDTLIGGEGTDILVGSDVIQSEPTPADYSFMLNTNTIDSQVVDGFNPSGTSDNEADILDGGNGTDFLVLGNSDVATGGAGPDVFKTGDWIDGNHSPEITDFSTKDDVLVIAYSGKTQPYIEIFPNNDGSYTVKADGETNVVLNGDIDPNTLLSNIALMKYSV